MELTVISGKENFTIFLQDRYSSILTMQQSIMKVILASNRNQPFNVPKFPPKLYWPYNGQKKWLDERAKGLEFFLNQFLALIITQNEAQTKNVDKKLLFAWIRKASMDK